MGSRPDNLYIDDKGTGVREFRVSNLDRYKVTDWESFNGANGKGAVRTIAENLTLAQANELAEIYGRAFPGALVNTMDEPYQGAYMMLTPDHPLYEQAVALMGSEIPSDIGLPLQD